MRIPLIIESDSFSRGNTSKAGISSNASSHITAGTGYEIVGSTGAFIQDSDRWGKERSYPSEEGRQWKIGIQGRNKQFDLRPTTKYLAKLECPFKNLLTV